MELDYSDKNPESRISQVNQLISETDPIKLTPQYLSYLSDFILFTAENNQTKKEKTAEHPIVTKNREVTTRKREVSYEEIVSSLENGEDGIYSIITHDKNKIMDPKDPINETDIEEIPGLKEQLEIIESLKLKFDSAIGRKKYLIKKQIIETYQQIYIIKKAFKGTPAKGRTSNQIKIFAHMPLEDKIWLDENGMPHNDGPISLFNPTHISFLLCYYGQLKQECTEDLNSDMFYLLLDLENLVTDTFLPQHEILFDLICWKIDGLTNAEIQQKMQSVHGVDHNEQYYSTLWRKRIPNMIAENAQKQYLTWYFTNIEYGTWKVCGKCKQSKLAHPLFYDRNNSKDSYYSICKECRKKS